MPTATGFSAFFNKPFVPANLTLYGAQSNTAKDVTLVGAHVGPIHGSLTIDPSNTTVTFNATSNYLLELNGLADGSNVSAVLPDDTYTVKFAFGPNHGFVDAGSVGANAANWATTFTTHYQSRHTPILGIPDFARGPDGNTPIQVPSGSSAGLPITFYNAGGVTQASFTLSYNPALLNITGALAGAGSDATDPDGSFVLSSNSAGLATFIFQDASPQSGNIVLGDIRAVVPNLAANLYQVKELLQIGNIVINGNAGTGAGSASGLHVNAYAGDVNGDGVINALDTLSANQVATGTASGFSAYAQLDPSIVGDVAGDLNVDAGDVSIIDAFVAQLHPIQIPQPPGFKVTSPTAADPTLSLVSTGPQRVSINLDDPHPLGSTGLISATLALQYDPLLLSVAPTDITARLDPQRRQWLANDIGSGRGEGANRRPAIQHHADPVGSSRQPDQHRFSLNVWRTTRRRFAVDSGQRAIGKHRCAKRPALRHGPRRRPGRVGRRYSTGNNRPGGRSSWTWRRPQRAALPTKP